jgi:hypothetical protein
MANAYWYDKNIGIIDTTVYMIGAYVLLQIHYIWRLP